MRFCLLAMPRTGSTRLAGLLASHPHIVCHDELFHVAGPKASGTCPLPSDLALDLERRSTDPLGWLEAVFEATARAAPEARAIGFKLQITDRPRVLEHVLLESDMRLVLLHRANRLAQFASARAAARTGRYYSSDPPTDGTDTPLAFDRADFLAFVERQALACNLVRDLVKDRSRLFITEYREVGTPAGTTALLDFLGQADVPLDAPDERMGSPIVRDRFADPEAIAAALAETVWRPWLDEPP